MGHKGAQKRGTISDIINPNFTHFNPNSVKFTHFNPYSPQILIKISIKPLNLSTKLQNLISHHKRNPNSQILVHIHRFITKLLLKIC